MAWKGSIAMDADAELTDSLATLRAWSASMTVARRGTRALASTEPDLGLHVEQCPRPRYLLRAARQPVVF
jgi:hypothetical protein